MFLDIIAQNTCFHVQHLEVVNAIHIRVFVHHMLNCLNKMLHVLLVFDDLVSHALGLR